MDDLEVRFAWVVLSAVICGAGALGLLVGIAPILALFVGAWLLGDEY